jgi:hypothetical protein
MDGGFRPFGITGEAVGSVSLRMVARSVAMTKPREGWAKECRSDASAPPHLAVAQRLPERAAANYPFRYSQEYLRLTPTSGNVEDRKRTSGPQ